MNRYNELGAVEARAIDLLINALASSPGAGESPVYAAIAAVREQHNYTVTLADYQVRYLIGHTYTEDGIGREVYDILVRIPMLTDRQQMTLKAQR
jgi:hypothetical protein